MKKILFLLVTASASVGHAQNARETQYLADMSRAMDTMMADMNVAPTGDVDADFVAMMTPHHQGAIAMAQAEMTYGQNELLRRIAQGIIIDQTQEIAAMRVALRDRPAREATGPSGIAPSTKAHEEHRHAP